jgi:hypothetical protein
VPTKKAAKRKRARGDDGDGDGNENEAGVGTNLLSGAPEFLRHTPCRLRTRCRVVDIIVGNDAILAVQRRQSPPICTLGGGDRGDSGTSSSASAALAMASDFYEICEYPLEPEPGVAPPAPTQLPVAADAVGNGGGGFCGSSEPSDEGGFVTYIGEDGSVLTGVADAGGEAEAGAPIDVAATQAAAVGRSSVERDGKRHRLLVMAVVLKPAPLSRFVLRGDADGLNAYLLGAGGSSTGGRDGEGAEAARLRRFAAEVMDGRRNPLHVAVSVLEAAGASDRSRRKGPVRSAAAAPTRTKATACLAALLEAPALAPVRAVLLSHTDAHGRTPLMAAVHAGEFAAAGALFDAAVALSPEAALGAARADGVAGCSLVHALVAHELSSYDIAGPHHVSQPVFECISCGIVREMCVSLGCARSCHRGHDVRYKGRAPSAYCDCREQGRCTATPPRPRAAGNHRLALLGKLATVDSLVAAKSVEGETVLFTLVTQLPSHLQFKKLGRSTSPAATADELATRSTALRTLARNWAVVKATILIGQHQPAPTVGPAAGGGKSLAEEGEMGSFVDPPMTSGGTGGGAATFAEDGSQGMHQQSSTVMLDHFCHQLLAENEPEVVALLVQTINRAVAKDARNMHVAARFVRSVVRVFAVISSGKLAVVTAHSNGSGAVGEGRSRGEAAAAAAAAVVAAAGGGGGGGGSGIEGNYSPSVPAVVQAVAVFKAFPVLAIQELAENADAIMAPVRMGFVRPHARFGSDRMYHRDTQSSSSHHPVVDPDEVGRRFPLLLVVCTHAATE